MVPAISPLSNLLSQMNATPRWRRNGMPPDPGRIIVFAHNDNIERACAAILAHAPQAEIIGFYAHKCHREAISVHHGGAIHVIPAMPPDCMASHPDCGAALYWENCVAPDLLYHLQTAIGTTVDIMIFPRVEQGEAGMKWEPGFYWREAERLEKIYCALADDESKLAFASVVKGIVAGDIEWLRPSSFPEYWHPRAKVEPGDVVIDAGLFDSTVTRKFALAAGGEGHVYGFEPEPRNYDFVQESLKKFGNPGNLEIVKMGLWLRRGTLAISGDGPSASICDACADASECEVSDLDSFARERRIDRIDLIKMDIEGAEMEALRGAAATIRRWRPKLQICAYHNIADLVDIPELVLGYCPEYRIYFTAHAPFLNEYVYYFTTGESNG